MVDERVLQWIEAAKQKGMKDREITNIMKSKGYPESRIIEALMSIKPPKKKSLSKLIIFLVVDIILVLVLLAVLIFVKID